MFDLSDDLKKISAGKILEAKGKEAPPVPVVPVVTTTEKIQDVRGRRD